MRTCPLCQACEIIGTQELPRISIYGNTIDWQQNNLSPLFSLLLQACFFELVKALPTTMRLLMYVFAGHFPSGPALTLQLP